MRGGGLKVPTGQEIACHFSQNHTVVTKLLDFIHKHLILKVVKSFFHYLDRFFRNLANTNKKIRFLGDRKSQNQIVFNFFVTKFSKFISMCVDPSTDGKLNDSSGGEVTTTFSLPILVNCSSNEYHLESFNDFSTLVPYYVQRYTYRVLQTIQMKLILLCVWA